MRRFNKERTRAGTASRRWRANQQISGEHPDAIEAMTDTCSLLEYLRQKSAELKSKLCGNCPALDLTRGFVFFWASIHLG